MDLQYIELKSLKAYRPKIAMRPQGGSIQLKMHGIAFDIQIKEIAPTLTM